MSDKISWYLKKYGTVENLLENGSREEKDDFLLKRMLLEVGYDDNPLGEQHALDAFLRVTPLMHNTFKFDDTNPYFSVFSFAPFEGKTNLFFPPDYLADSFSISQFYQFHTALLFLDREVGNKILLGDIDDFVSLPNHIRNFNDSIWMKNRILIMNEGAKSLSETNVQFREQLLNTSNMLMVYNSRLSFWGKGKSEMDRNYWGKILTRIKCNSLNLI